MDVSADLDGCDNFNGSSIAAGRWFGPVAASGVGFQSETNQWLEFTTTGTNFTVTTTISGQSQFFRLSRRYGCQ
jgi:hypothetical protein